jgi:DNA repair exonuclease SbcCD nuclease subunit
MKFVHAADLHLDSPLAGLDRYDGAPVAQIRGATRRAMQNLVELCVAEGAKLLVLAGDLFDGDWKDFTSGLFFVRQMQVLRKAGIQVVIVRGNHDAASQVTRHLRLPDNVRELSSLRPETVCFEDLGVCVHGQSYARRAENDDLSIHYPEARSGYFNIGLLHTSATGRPGHADYAPCSVDVLRSKGYDYWALGHVHQREVLSEAPWIVFPGNLQGRHIRECGAKGATLVEVEAGRVSNVEHRALDVVRFEVCEVLVSEDTVDVDAALDAVEHRLNQLLSQAESRLLVVRVIVQGATELHALLQRDAVKWEAEIRSRAFERTELWIESVRFRTQSRGNAERARRRPDAVGEVLRALDRYRNDEVARLELAPLFAELQSKLPAEVRELGVRPGDVTELELLLQEVDQLLLTELVVEGELD